MPADQHAEQAAAGVARAAEGDAGKAGGAAESDEGVDRGQGVIVHVTCGAAAGQWGVGVVCVACGVCFKCACRG